MNISKISCKSISVSPNLKYQNSTINFKGGKTYCLPKYLEQARIDSMKRVTYNKAKMKFLMHVLTNDPKNTDAATAMEMYKKQTHNIINNFNTTLTEYCNKKSLNLKDYKWFFLWENARDGLF